MSKLSYPNIFEDLRPWMELNFLERVEQVKNRDRSKQPFRPCLEVLRKEKENLLGNISNDDLNDVIDLIEKCWHENPNIRPTFPGIQEQMKFMKTTM